MIISAFLQMRELRSYHLIECIVHVVGFLGVESFVPGVAQRWLSLGREKGLQNVL